MFNKELRKIYPNIKESTETLIELEKQLYEYFFLKVASLINAAPENWQDLFLGLLIKFEIENIKKIIHGITANLPRAEIQELMYGNVERILEHEKLINILLNQKLLEDLLFVLKNAAYSKPLREGLTHYKQEGDLFHIQAYLDRFFLLNLMQSGFQLKGKAAEIWDVFLNLEAEKYNFVTLYRGLYNHLDPELIRELLVPGGMYVQHGDIYGLLALKNLEEFPEAIYSLLRKRFVPVTLIERTLMHNSNPILGLTELYYQLFKRKNLIGEDLEAKTFGELLEYVNHKIRNIKKITAIAVKIVHKIQESPLIF